ncbi:MAG TPA: PIN domain-containing protein, partial [Mycobacterium sp.]|nr:PIN domain-containing protein [Mycobacterium sp.]
LGVVDDVLSIGRSDVEHAKDTLLRYPILSARDALHVAVMARRNIAQLMSFDRGFDSYPGIKRLA